MKLVTRYMGSSFPLANQAMAVTGPYFFPVMVQSISLLKWFSGSIAERIWIGKFSSSMLMVVLSEVRQTYFHPNSDKVFCNSMPSNSPSPKKTTVSGLYGNNRSTFLTSSI